MMLLTNSTLFTLKPDVPRRREFQGEILVPHLPRRAVLAAREQRSGPCGQLDASAAAIGLLRTLNRRLRPGQ